MPSHKAYGATGKQVLWEGAHYADAVTPDAAGRIADALNAAEEQASWSAIVAQLR